MIVVVIKGTVAMLLALGVVALTRRARASLRHAVLAATFALLLLLPVAGRVMPAVSVPVPEVARPVVVTPVDADTGTAAVRGRTAAAGEGARAPWEAIYGAGVGLMLGWLGLGIVRLRRWAAKGEVWLDGTRLATGIACASGIRRAVLVVLSGEIAVPITFGFRRQTIVLPEAARDWDDRSLRRALRHELEHVRRDDWALQIMARVACAVWWPHPLVWVAFGRFCAEAERACDDAVVGAFEPTSYAEQLVALARSLTRRPRVPALSMASPTRLAERVHAILDPAQRRGPHGRIAGVTTIAVMTAALAVFGSLHLVAATIEADDDTDGDAVVRAAERGDAASLAAILHTERAINTSYEGDGTPLLVAARHGRLELAKFLLDHGADPNVPSPGDGNPLIAAAGRGQVEMARLLLDRGALIDAVVPGDETALITACRFGKAKMVRFLISRGADVNLGAWSEGDRGGEWRTPLLMARRAGDEEIVKMLTAAGATR